MRTAPENLCMGCMEAAGSRVCPLCGWAADTDAASLFHLRPRTVLDGRYLLGRVLGAGGFGITYLGWDLNLGVKLAIKEYFPSAFGARGADRTTVVPSTTQSRTIFDQGLTRFLEEGRALAKFQGNPCIASVLTFFSENGTSYLVMKYEDGITLQQYLHERGGRIEHQKAMDLAMPVMDALRAVHEAGILHRDISPDNIFITRGGQVKILDFGSAKHDLAMQNRSTQITLKRGYSPEEQYRSNGKVGPWTDVYALGATIYHAITGQVPPESLDRLDEDSLQPPSKCGIQLPGHVEQAIMRALAVRAAGRFQTMKEFQNAITAGPAVAEPPHPTVHTAPRQPGKAIRWPVWLAVVAGALCLLVGLFWMTAAPPRIIRFEAEPAAVTSGQSTVLRWSVNRGSVTIEPGVGRVDETSGARSLTPSATMAYTLTARRLLRSASRSVVVVVSAVPAKKPGAPSESKPAVPVPQPPVPRPPEAPKVQPPQIVSFTADPSAVTQGQSATLTWSMKGDVKASSIEGIGRVEPDGTRSVSPAATTTYTLTANGPAGSDRKSVTVTVNQPPPLEPAGVLHIEILDENGRPMPALIEVEGTGARSSIHTLSPSHTGIQEGSLLPGTYKVTVTAEGYAAAATSTTIVSGAQTTIRIHMVHTPK